MIYLITWLVCGVFGTLAVLFALYLMDKSMSKKRFRIQVKHCFGILIGILFGPISMFCGTIWTIMGFCMYYFSHDSPGYVNGRWTRFKEKVKKVMNYTLTEEEVKY